MAKSVTGRLQPDKSGPIASTAPACDEILDKHKTAFKDELGRVDGMIAKFHINQDGQPKFFKAQPVCYALRTKIAREQGN